MIEQVRPAEFDDWLRSQGARPLVLDVREPWELQVASVRPVDFDLLTVPMNQVPARLAELPTGRPIACLCHHGVRSQHVALYLAHQGYTDVVNIAGGIEAWSRDRDPSVPLY
jgi:rhodanese-related sulfurtransferase